MIVPTGSHPAQPERVDGGGLAFVDPRSTTRSMRFVRATSSLALVALAALSGCGSDAAGGDAAGGAAGDGAAGDGAGGAGGPRVVLGTGRELFEPLDSEESVPLIKGIQGGFHVWTSFLAYGFDTDVLRMELATRWDELDGSALEMAGNVAVRPGVDAEGTAVLLSLGWPASIFNPACANGRRLGIDLTVRDTSAGLSASDSRHWIVDVAAEDRSTDCAE